MCGAVIALALIAVSFCSSWRASAQDASADALERALQAQQQHGGVIDQDEPLGLQPGIQTYRPVLPIRDVGPPSRLEQLYSQRAGRVLKQFGYDVLGVPSSVAIVQSGALQDDYVLGVGDEIIIVFRGQENATYRQRIDRDGRVVFPKLGPILAAGRPFGDVRRDIEAQVSQAFISTSAFVSIGSVHQLSVLVSGEVRSPGMRIISALASPLDAILLSGGISKTGSLRNIRIVHGGEERIVDLYSVIARGDASGLGMLRDGDRIYIPPLGQTVAVAGYVRRPGIYELRGSTRGISARTLIELAGGTVIAGSYRVSKTHLDRDGTSTVVPVVGNSVVESGEVLYVDAGRNATTINRVTLIGSVAIENSAPLSGSQTLNALLRGTEDLKYNAYTQFAVIARRDPVSNAITLVPFSLEAVMNDRETVPARSNDIVYIFNNDEIRALAALATSNINKAEQPGENLLGGGENQGNAQSANPYPQQSPQDATHQQPFGSAQQASSPYGTYYQPPQPNPDLLNPNDPLAGTQAQYPSSTPLPPQPGLQQPNGGTGAPYYGQNDQTTGLSSSDPNDLRMSGARDNMTSGSEALSEAQILARREAGGGQVGAFGTQGRPVNNTMLVDNIASRLGVPRTALISIADDNLVWVLDEVRVPGPYIAAKGTTLANIIQAAGGARQQADFSGVEVTSTAFDQMTGDSRTVRTSYDARSGSLGSVAVSPLDVIRLRGVYSNRDEGTVTVAGQVRYPGVFDITRDERLSSVLQRAGGMTDVAYPYGAIFTRKTAALTEREGNIRASRQIEAEIATLAASPTTSPNAVQSGTYLTTLAQELRDTPVLGRVTITADPTVLATKPQLDVVLEPGDTVFIPKRPSSISVSGEVLNPGSFQYRASYTSDDYVRLAGGTTQSADEDRSFVVFPDGSARPIGDDWLSFRGDNRLPPGSTIVVPRDLSPFDLGQFLKDATQIVSQLAVTAASLSVIQTNN